MEVRVSLPCVFSPLCSVCSQVLLRARAIETQCFVIAAAQVGRHHQSRASFGHALLVDPWGEVIGRCGGEEPGLALAEIDMEKLKRVRRDMPVQTHRREAQLYQGHTSTH